MSARPTAAGLPQGTVVPGVRIYTPVDAILLEVVFRKLLEAKDCFVRAKIEGGAKC